MTHFCQCECGANVHELGFDDADWPGAELGPPYCEACATNGEDIGGHGVGSRSAAIHLRHRLAQQEALHALEIKNWVQSVRDERSDKDAISELLSAQLEDKNSKLKNLGEQYCELLDGYLEASGRTEQERGHTLKCCKEQLSSL